MTELTSAQIEEMIKTLQAQRKTLTGRTTKPKTPQVKLSCVLCGEMDIRDNLVRTSKSEYCHASCVIVTTNEIPKTYRKVFTISLVFSDITTHDPDLVNELTKLNGIESVRVLTSRIVEK